MTQQSLSARAWAELALLSLIWGASFLSIRVALDEIGPAWVVGFRVSGAALVLWLYVLLRGIQVPTGWRLWGAFAVMGCLNNIIPFGLMAWGQLYIETGLTSILNAATAIWGVLIAALVFADERLTLAKGLGVTLGFLGVATAIGLGTLAQIDLRSLAQLAVIAGTVSYALAGTWARLRLQGVRAEVAALGMLTASTVLALPGAWIIEGPVDVTLSATTWLSIGYFAVIATAFAYLLYFRVLAMAGSGNMLLCTLLIAPVAILLGALVLDEALAPRAFVGFGLLGVGLLILSGIIPLPKALAPGRPAR